MTDAKWYFLNNVDDVANFFLRGTVAFYFFNSAV